MDSEAVSIFICGLPLVFVVFSAVYVTTVLRGEAMLRRWAEKNKLELSEMKFRLFRVGPFFIRSSRSQAVFRITVRTQGTGVRNGYALCGGYWAGIWKDAVEVEWDA